MPLNHEGERRESCIVAWLAIVVLVAGHLLMWTSLQGVLSSAVWTMDKVTLWKTLYQTARRNEFFAKALTTYEISWSLLIVSCGVVLAGLIGTIGACRRQKAFMCVYVVAAGALGTVAFGMGMHIVDRKVAVEPMVAQAVLRLCRPRTYIKITQALPCRADPNFHTKGESCRRVCSDIVDGFKQMGHNDEGTEFMACSVMRQICAEFEYEALDSSVDCATAIRGASTEESYAIPWIDAYACRRQCDLDIKCTSYAYSEQSAAQPALCILGSGEASLHPRPNWTALSLAGVTSKLERGGGIECAKRRTPIVLETFRAETFFLSTTSLLLSCTLLVSACGSLCLLYNMNFKRKGKPTAVELCLMMCCPCCVEQRYTLSEDDLDSNEDEGSEYENDL